MAVLNAEQMKRGINRLEKLINEIRSFDTNTIQKRWGPEGKALEASIEGTLASVFGHNTVEYNRYKDAADLDKGPIVAQLGPSFGRGHVYQHDDAAEARQYMTEGKERSTQLLHQAVRWLQDELADTQEQVTSSGATAVPALVLSRKVFIVHGHDSSVREAVARFIERIGFQAIILHEQANQGRTIIEKVEAHGDVGFAVVLLTPDDVGCKAGDTTKPRARQNVLLELGYFIGRLGRANVCALATSDTMELPTDFAGVVWEPFDAAGGWKSAIGRELKAAGFEIDWNKIMNS